MGLFLKTSQQNFRKVKEIIDTYECISGAQLNLSKSLILPLRAGPTPAWFGEIGCQIGQPGQVFKYRGTPIGINLSTDAELEFLLDKVWKKLRHWSHKMLSMTGRTVYIKHILRSVPVYNLMVFDYTQTGLRALESISCKFLWGASEDGGDKLPLVAWERLTRPKTAGGLDFYTFKSQGKLLKLCNISKMLADYQSEWVWFANEFIKKGLRTGQQKQFLKFWNPAEYLLLLPEIKISSKTV
jgi:hypothetical protein